MARRKDPLSKMARSERMSRVRSRGNASTEQRVARALRAAGLIGWRRHAALPGKPDFFFPKLRVAIFVHGCFWHGCDVCRRRVPANNRTFWRRKIEANRARDRRVKRLLARRSIGAVTVWEHELQSDVWLARVRRVLNKREI